MNPKPKSSRSRTPAVGRGLPATPSSASSRSRPARPPSQVTRHPARGRPTKLTRPLIARICRHIRAGNFLETSAFACGVTRQTLYNWLRTANAALALRSEDRSSEMADSGASSSNSHLPSPSDSCALNAQESLCVELLDAMEQATSEADIADLAIIEAAAETDWRAAAWRTARRDRRRERDLAKGAVVLSFVPGSPVVEPEKPPPPPTPESHPHLFMTPEEKRRYDAAEDEKWRAERRAEYFAWKNAHDAKAAAHAAAGTKPTAAEEQHDARMAERFRHVAWLAEMEPWWAKLELIKRAKAEGITLPFDLPDGPATSNGPPPPSPTKPRSTFVMA